MENENGTYVIVNGFRLFYRVFGKGSNVLLCLHGGPGAMHDYLLPLAKLGDENLRVILYDQLGCGKSQKPLDTSLFTADHYVDEIEELRRILGLGKINLMGSSWGGMLALLYALKYQQNIKKLIVTGALVSTHECVEEMNRLKTLLPKDVQETLTKYEAKWAFSHPEYLRAVDVFYRKFFCRLPQWPEEVTRTLNETSVPVYFTMWGPNEFTALGNLKNLDFKASLPQITVPTLVTGGRHDEVTPRIAQGIHQAIKGSGLSIFENSAHLPMWEEQDEYLQTVREFILN